MELPKFIMGDHADLQDEILVIHTEFPRFIINLVNDQVYWMEDIADEEEDQLAEEMARLIEQADIFYDEQVKRYEED